MPSIDWDQQMLRALLFVPGNDRRKLAKAGAAGADVVVIDLEDAVADTEKTEARAVARQALPSAGRSSPVAVRVNGIDTGRLEADIAAVAAPGLSAVVVPKVEASGVLAAANEALTDAERSQGLASGTIAMLALIETPLGIARCEEIMLDAPRRTVTAMLGVADLSAALGVDATPEGTELLYARSRLIVAARAAGMPAPVDGPYLQIGNPDGLLLDSRRSCRLGFQGRVALHPRQIGPIQQVYSELSDDEAAAARRIVEAFEDAEAGRLASIRVDDTFVDYPVYRLALAKLRRHEAYVRSASP
jgi:citrate lyase subunit beta / citryl-CoA lyase